MLRAIAWIGGSVVMLAWLAGCQPAIRPVERQSDEGTLFGPSELRVHPFTAIKDWTGEGRADGVEVLVELLDRFKDPTKATGTLIFELYQFRKNYPDVRGERLVAWRGSLLTLEDQRMHYNRISRTYSFQLAYPDVRLDKNYVLQVWFEHAGKRLTSQVILESQESKGVIPTAIKPAATPVAEPGTRPATPQSSGK